MATQNEPPVRVFEAAAGSLVSKGQTSPIKAEDASIDRDEWPRRDDSLTARFLYNLRVALAAPHT